jgi:uncharacterized membrane protein YphA (DoxX/SURF4 family)
MSGCTFLVAGMPKLQNVSINQDFLGSLGISPELVIPAVLLEVIIGYLSNTMIM